MHFCNTVHLLMSYRIFVILMLCSFLEKKKAFSYMYLNCYQCFLNNIVHRRQS